MSCYVQKPKSDDFSIGDLLLGLSKRQHEKLWSGLFELCAKTLAKLNAAADPVEQVWTMFIGFEGEKYIFLVFIDDITTSMISVIR